MMKKTCSSQRGFGLVEVLVALVLLAIGVLALARFQGVGMKDISSSRNHSQAMELAQAKLESLRDFKDGDAYAAIVSGSDGAPIAGENTSYQRSWTVQTFTNPRYKQVDILVQWKDALGDDKEVRVASNIGYQNPVQSGVELNKFYGGGNGGGGDGGSGGGDGGGGDGGSAGSGGGDGGSKSGDGSSKSGDGGSKSGDGSSKSGDGSSKSGDGSSKSGDSSSKSGDGSSKSGDSSSKSGDGGKSCGDGGKSSDGGSKSSDSGSKSSDSGSKAS